jgi:hypothetical protein
MSSTQYSYASTAAYFYTNFPSRTQSILEYKPTSNIAETGFETFLFWFSTLLLNIPVGLVKAFSIYASCIDPKDSLISQFTSNQQTIAGVGNALGVISGLGSLASDFTFYFHTVGNSAIYFKRQMEKISLCDFCIGLLIIVPFFHLAGSAAYSLYYQLYFIEALKTYYGSTFTITDTIIGLNKAVVAFSMARNFFSVFKNMSTPEHMLKIHESTTDPETKAKKDIYRPLNLAGKVALFLGLADVIFTAYSTWMLAARIYDVPDYEPSVDNPTASTILDCYIYWGALIYPIQYLSISIVQGTARAFDVYTPKIGSYCCSFSKAGRGEADDEEGVEEEYIVRVTGPEESSRRHTANIELSSTGREIN